MVSKELKEMLYDLNSTEIIDHVENDTIEYFLIAWKDEFERRLEAEINMQLFKKLAKNENFVTLYVHRESGKEFASYLEVLEDAKERYGESACINEHYTVFSREV